MKPINLNPEDLFSKYVWGIQHDAFEDPVSRSAKRAYELGVCDDLIAGILGNRVAKLQRHEALGKLVPFRVPRLYRGEIVLGKEGISFPLQWTPGGILIAGNTGSGKSILLFSLAFQMGFNRCAVWVSENYKTQFRHLLPVFQRMGIKLVILGAKNWRWNLLQAESDPRIHLTTAVDLLCHLPEMPSRARAILRQTCHSLYRKFGIWEGRKDAWPTLFDLFETVRTTQGLNEPARDAILDRLGALLVALTPKCGAYRLAWNATDLARYSIIFEMRGAPEMVKQILLESSLFSIFQMEIERGVVNGPANLFVAFDDSQKFFEQRPGSETAGMDELAGIIRGTGKCLCVCVQTMRGLSLKLIPNLTLKIFGRLGCNDDYEALGTDMGLTREQRNWAKLHLQPGMFIGQVGTGEWREPFLFHAPLINLPSVVTDQEADDCVRELDCLPTVAATEFEKWEPHSSIDVGSCSKASNARLAASDLRYVKAVIAQPGKSSSHYGKIVGINGRRAAEIRRRLVQQGYLREHSISTSPRGRSAIVLEPLAPALDAVERKSEGQP